MVVDVPPAVSTIFKPALKPVPLMVTACVLVERTSEVGFTLVRAGGAVTTGAGAGAAATGAVTVRLEVGDTFPSTFATCSVHVLAVVPTFNATVIAVDVSVVGDRAVTAPPE